MNRTFRRTGSAFTTLAVLVLISVAPAGAERSTTPEAVRTAAAEHARTSGGKMTFDDPSGGGQLTLAFDHVHDGVKTTEGGRQVVCVDFKSPDGTVYDVDFYVDRAEISDALLVEDAVIHKVRGKSVLSDARREELDRKQ